MRVDRVKFATELARTGMKLYELAGKSGVTRVTVSALKSGNSCRKKTVEQIAAGLGVPLSALLPDETEAS